MPVLALLLNSDDFKHVAQITPYNNCYLPILPMLAFSVND